MTTHLIHTFTWPSWLTTERRGLCRDGNGRIWVALSGFNGVSNDIYVAYTDDEGFTWVLEQVTNNPAGAQGDQVIAVDSLNRLHLAWSGTGWGANPAVENIQYRRRTEAGWEAQVGITDGPAPFAYRFPTIAVDRNDNIRIIWPSNGTVAPLGDWKILLISRTATGWTPIEVVVPSPGPGTVQTLPVLAIGTDNYLHIFWQGDGWGSNPAFFNCQYIRGIPGSWGAVEQVTDVAVSQSGGSIALDSNNYPYITWYAQGWGANPAVENIQYRRRMAAGWGVQESITDSPDTQEIPAIALDLNGNVYVAWQGYGWGANPGVTQILYRQRTATGWQPTVLITNSPLISQNPNILWAANPTIGGYIADVPETGLSLAYGEDDQHAYFYYPVLSWPGPTPLTPSGVATNPATNVTENAARLHGLVQQDSGHWGYARFQWGLTTEYGNNTEWMGGYSTGDEFFSDLSGLAEGQGYHFRAQFRSFEGVIVNGQDRVFNTLSPLGPVTLISEDLAYLLEAG
jgi:hypothetical protein